MNGFQNALAAGLQLGGMVRQRQDEREYRNALLGQQQAKMAAEQQQAAQKQAEQRRADLPMVTRLLETAQDQASYERNLGVAQQYGIDVSNLPAQFDPAWRDQQLTTLRALSTPEGQSALSTIGKEVADMGFQPGTPQFNAEVTRRWEQTQARTFSYQPGGGAGIVNPATGEVRQFVVPGTAPQQQMPAQAPAPQPQQTPNIPVVPEDIFRNDVNSLGLQGAINFAVSKGLAVPITGDAEFAALPSGAAFVGPDGLMRRKP